MGKGQAAEPLEKSVVREESLARTRADVEQVCRLLESPTPEVLRGTAGLLGSAVTALTRYRSRPLAAGVGRAEIEELQGLQKALRRAAALLRRVYEYHAGWGAYLGSRSRGYGAGGQAAAWVPPRRFSLEG